MTHISPLLPFYTFSITISPPATVIYVDAARDDLITGIGYTIDGEIHLDGQRYFEGHHTSMEAEHLAVVEALRVATVNSSERETCDIYTDCEPVVGKMRGTQNSSDNWAKRQSSYRWLAGKWDDCTLASVGRELNEEAHELAREALFEGREEHNL